MLEKTKLYFIDRLPGDRLYVEEYVEGTLKAGGSHGLPINWMIGIWTAHL